MRNPALPIQNIDETSVECLGDPIRGRVVLTCEHASAHVPEPWKLSDAERAFLPTHWGQDRGAAALTRALQKRLQAPAVLARFSRLLVDANRPPDHPDTFRTEVEGQPFAFNKNLSPDEKARRIALFHVPYHAAIDRIVGARKRAGLPTLLLSVHCFTKLYLNQPRTVQLGVLYDHTDPCSATSPAGILLAHLRAQGRWDVRPNEPWSGMNGLVYSICRHGSAHRVPYLELEVRDDLLESDTSTANQPDVSNGASMLEDIADAVAEGLDLILDHAPQFRDPNND